MYQEELYDDFREVAGVKVPFKITVNEGGHKLADVVVVTKGDIVSQAEREVFAYNVALANPRAAILFFNGSRLKKSGRVRRRL